jgi:hypothetical protein
MNEGKRATLVLGTVKLLHPKGKRSNHQWGLGELQAGMSVFCTNDAQHQRNRPAICANYCDIRCKLSMIYMLRRLPYRGWG